MIYLMMTGLFDETLVEIRRERLTYVFYGVLVSVVYLGWDMPILNLIANIGGLYLLSLCYKSSFGKRILASCLIFSILLTLETICVIIFEGMKYSMWKNGEGTVIMAQISSQILTFIVAMLFRYIGKKKQEIRLSWQYWICLVMISVFSIYEFMLLYSGVEIREKLVVVSIVFTLLVDFIVYYLYQQLQVAMKNQYEKKIIELQNHFFENQLEIMKDSNERIRSWKHDMNNHLTMIQSIMKEQHREKGEDYILEILESPDMKKDRVRTGNTIIDSVLNYKTDLAERKGIKVDVDINVPANITVDSAMWVTILANLLDNAIEAAQKVTENPYIKVKLRYGRERFFLKIMNSYNGDIRQEDGVFLTTKDRNRDMHGLGLTSVRNTIGNFGEMNLHHTDEEFIVEVICLTHKKEMDED